MTNTDPRTDVRASAAPALLGVHHVSIDVDDVEVADRFYLETLGLKRIDRPDIGIGGTWMVAGNGVQIHLVQRDGATGPDGNHFAFQVGDIEAVITDLRGRDIKVSDSIPINGGFQAFFRDPCGNILELNQPPG